MPWDRRYKRFWQSMKVSDTGAEPLDGYVRRAWGSVHVHYLDTTGKMDDRGRMGNKFFFVIVAYTNGNEALFDIRVKYDSLSSKAIPVPIETLRTAIEGIVDEGVYLGYGFDAVEFVKVGGRQLIKAGCSGGLFKENIYHTVPGFFCDTVGDVLGFMMRYPDTIKTYKDGCAAAQAMKTLTDNLYRIGQYATSEKRSLLDRMESLQRQMEECNANFDATCAQAAEAINSMSSEFGIEIEI